MQWIIVEKRNHLRIHGIYDSQERAEWALRVRIPNYVEKGYFMDKTLKANDFEVIMKPGF